MEQEDVGDVLVQANSVSAEELLPLEAGVTEPCMHADVAVPREVLKHRGEHELG